VGRHPVGEAAIQEVLNNWRIGKFHYAWVYPRDGAYVLSNDYVILAAVERARADYVPCWVLTYPTVNGVVGVSGPVEPSVVRLILDSVE
jgi:hypothetical protein